MVQIARGSSRRAVAVERHSVGRVHVGEWDEMKKWVLKGRGAAVSAMHRSARRQVVEDTSDGSETVSELATELYAAT